MERLVDATSLKDRASEYTLNEDEYKRFCAIIDAEPTAYNVDAVVSELDKASCDAQPVGWSAKKEIVELKTAIEIVKGGGADETN